MKTTLLCLSAALLSLGACSHARTAPPPEAPGQGAEASGEGGSGSRADEPAEARADEEDKGAADRGSKPERAGSSSGGDRDADSEPDPEAIEVATSAKGLLQSGAEAKVRERLGVAESEKGYRGALMRFQRDHDLPATGMLDHETVEALGLDPDEIFQSAGD